MSDRCSLVYDDGSKIDFNNKADALHHLRVAGFAGVVGLHRDADGEPGRKLRSREQLGKRVAELVAAERR